MPSLHLDIPSIDWIERPPPPPHAGGGKTISPAPDGAAPGRERVKSPAQRKLPERDCWPDTPAVIPA